jgi:hypothetical protein
MGITWDMVDSKARSITVPEDMTKIDEPHSIYLSDPHSTPGK